MITVIMCIPDRSNTEGRASSSEDSIGFGGCHCERASLENPDAFREVGLGGLALR